MTMVYGPELVARGRALRQASFIYPRTGVENTLNRNKFGDYLESTEFSPAFDIFLGYFVS